ncbi:glycosyltransferase family 2 protein [Phaeobacter porticola]|uniref:Glycosyl transferase family 2 n=1 Tax=Phaeobacter porticola TaxID=1844006 RepID=A0A1L3I854_9RHOB|nr:glycosyltransferase family 2 protein [Phaeobacter porticola]APG48192.1 Glycosyl transferase family 2 [Phaeobacter porticola]
MTGTDDGAQHPQENRTRPRGNGVAARLSGLWDRYVALPGDRLRFSASVRHISGPRQPKSTPDAVTVIALVRDGAYYLDVFLSHYRALGVTHFVFCDTGSADGTLARLAAEPDVTVLQSLLPWGRFENMFRGYAARRFCQDRWCLFADMDEILEFEGQNAAGLPGLITYLERHGYTAMMAQMLEMFPNAPLTTVADLSYRAVQDQFCHYDITAVRALPYDSKATGLSYFLQQNELPDTAEPKMQFDGIRGAVFGERCCLSKHPLVHIGEGVAPAVHPHLSTGVRVADVMAVLKHYKFANNALARDRASQSSEAIPHGEDALRVAGFSADPDLSLWSTAAQVYEGPALLRAQGFVQLAPRYLKEIT